jgi:hypothetical protein
MFGIHSQAAAQPTSPNAETSPRETRMQKLLSGQVRVEVHKVLERLADDLQKGVPGMAGFSRSNVFRMRAFYLAYRGVEIVAQAVRSGGVSTKVAQAVRQLPDQQPPEPIANTPGGIMSSCSKK